MIKRLLWWWPLLWRGLTIKLILIYLGVILLGVLLVGGAMRHAFREGYQHNIKPHLIHYIHYLREDLGDPPDKLKAQQLAAKIPVEIYFQSSQAQWSTTGRAYPELDDIDYWRHRKHRYGSIKFAHNEGDNIAIITADTYTLLFISPDGDEHWRPIMLLPLLIVIAAFILLYYLTQRLFAPLHIIRKAVNAFGGGDLAQRLAITRRDELGDVATSFNHMADRIQNMLESKRAMLLAISHELRSPLTRAKLAVAMLDDKKQRDEIEDELTEMASLIGELLETERLNAGHSALNLEPVDMIDLLTASVESLGAAVQCTLPTGPLWLQADAVRLRLVMKNLLENALKYTPAAQPIPEVGVRHANTQIEITVRDHGPGIAPAHLAHICEPFYRVDPARQRATGGYGLGLYLCRVIVEAHHGTLHVASTVDQGTCITLSLPVASPSRLLQASA